MKDKEFYDKFKDYIPFRPREEIIEKTWVDFVNIHFMTRKQIKLIKNFY